MNLYKPSTAIIPGSSSDPSRSKVTTSSMFNNISASQHRQQSPQQQTQQPNRKIFVPSSLLLQHQPQHQPSQSQSQNPNPYVNTISQHYPEVRLRRPQISSVNPLFSNNHNNNNINPNGVSESKVKLLPRPSSYHSSSSRSSSFCDDTNTNTNANAQPNQFEYDFDGTLHPSAGADCFVDPIERDLLENWLEVEFQQNFKRLHSLIRRCSSRSEANFDFETGNEILFLRRPATAISDVDSLQISPQRNGKPQNECHKSKNNNNNTTSSYQLTNWLMARRSGGGAEAPKNVPKSRKSSTFEEFESFQPDDPSSPMQSVLSRSYPPWLSTRLATLERLLLCESRNEITQFTNSVKSYDSLICLAIAEPNDKAKRDALLYSYPPSSSDTESEFVPSILKLGGMFITLAEIFDILHSSRAFEHANGDHRAASNVQTCRIRVVPGSGVANEEFDPTISTKRNYVFTIIRDKFELDFDSKKPNKRSPAILLLVGLPECSGYTELDCRCMASLVEESLVARFGSLQRMFSPFFAPQNTQLSEKQLIRAHLSHTMSVYETLISPPSSEKSVDSTSGACSSLEAILTLSNSFFNPLDSVNMKVNCLPLRSLPADYSVTSQTCKLLNYYDSLDWLDESVTRFYRKDSMDLEHALSEHFARCLQWQCSSGSGSGETPSKPREDANNNENGKELQNDFDLLELELSSFTVKGSVLFFRGLLVQSNLAYSVLNPIYHRLFSKGLLALSKHLPSDLVYFTDFEEMEPCKDPVGQASNHFLLILGYGHLLHCSVVQVHCFDRSAPPPESTSSLNTPNGTLKSKNTDDPPHPGTLPSSFAFYVFIKESFRFLCSNFSSQNTNGPVDMHYEQQLENIYRLGQQIANENFSQLSQFDKKSKKKMSKRDKEFERRLALMEKANKKQRDKLDKMDVRSKVLVEGVVETGKRTSVGSLMDDERTRGSNGMSTDESECSISPVSQLPDIVVSL